MPDPNDSTMSRSSVSSRLSSMRWDSLLAVYVSNNYNFSFLVASVFPRFFVPLIAIAFLASHKSS